MQTKQICSTFGGSSIGSDSRTVRFSEKPLVSYLGSLASKSHCSLSRLPAHHLRPRLNLSS